MKISKIPGLGRFGVFIDDIDFNNLTEEEWMEIGKLHLESLVTIIRNVNLDLKSYYYWMLKWGKPRHLDEYNIRTKYPDLDPNNPPEEIQKWLESMGRIQASEISPDAQVARVSGKFDDEGHPIGMFAEGELLWHSNESGNLVFTPGVALYGYEGMVGSSTGFVTTPDWYEDQSESFRSELDEMILLHTFTPGKINPGLREEHDSIMYRNMCPEDCELPLICLSPAGIKGLHYSVNTIHSIKGMSPEESRKVFDYIDKTLFVDKYIYDHWYQENNDLMLFDNSIVSNTTMFICQKMITDT
jgi:hypothetical protein